MKKLLLAAATISVSFFSATAPGSAETTECTVISAIPTVISQQGVYCLKHNIATSASNGRMIEIATNNVTIDFNGYKLGGLAAGPYTQTVGIYAKDRKNIKIRNGSIRGFYKGIEIKGYMGSSAAHLIEDMSFEGNTWAGMQINGRGVRILNNQIDDTGNGSHSTTSHGIFVDGGRNVVIAGNLVSGVEETFGAYGIIVVSTELADIRDNSVFGVKGGTNSYGIMSSQSKRISASSNRVMTDHGNGIGILSYSTTKMFCTGNIVSGFATNISACYLAAGNFTD